MPHKKQRTGSGGKVGGTKLPRVGAKGVKGHNSGGTSPAGAQQVAGNSHQGSSNGKRNSG